jgi:arylsulfatase A-like enzyme
VATLTGKSPLATRVLYPPNILNGVDAYQHLPALLKRQGYRNIEAAVPYYVDAENLNMQDGFESINGREVVNQQVYDLLTKYWFSDAAYFLSSLNERLGDRLEHIFYQERMLNPYLVVTQRSEPLEDRAKLNDLFAFMEQSEQPVFAHLHFMGTHGAYFAPSRQIFSAGQEQTEEWMTDFYDDAILEFDGYVGEVVSYLEDSGEMDNTLLVILSDHTQKYWVNKRLPLIMHFPGGEHAGRLQANTQNLDIAPTILDYLGVELPLWMEGASLIGADLDPERLITAARVKNALNEEDGFYSLEPGNLQPPFFQFGHFGIIQCQWWFEIDTEAQNWTWGEIEGHTSPCSGSGEARLEGVKDALQAKLIENGFLPAED